MDYFLVVVAAELLPGLFACAMLVLRSAVVSVGEDFIYLFIKVHPIINNQDVLLCVSVSKMLMGWA